MFGAGGGTSSYQEIEETDLIILWGSNARETHPIFFHHLLKGKQAGARLFAIDPRRTTSVAWADVWMGLEVGSDVALANAIGREIIAAGLCNAAFIARATSGFEEYKAAVEAYTLEHGEKLTGVKAEDIRDLGCDPPDDARIGVDDVPLSCRESVFARCHVRVFLHFRMSFS